MKKPYTFKKRWLLYLIPLFGFLLFLYDGHAYNEEITDENFQFGGPLPDDYLMYEFAYFLFVHLPTIVLIGLYFFGGLSL